MLSVTDRKIDEQGNLLNEGNWNRDYVDSRFGKLAYISPVTSWPTIPRVAQQYGLKVEQDDSGKYKFWYPRTNRALAGVNPISAGGKDNRIAPWTADTILDYKDYLDRTDPNYYQYNLKDTSGSKASVNPLLESMTNLSSGREGVKATPVGGGTTQWENPMLTALSKMLGA